MKPDIDKLIELANFIFPDDTALALFNMMAEVMTGTLPSETIAGDPAMAGRDDGRILAICGVTMLGGKPCRPHWYREPLAGEPDLIGMIAQLGAVTGQSEPTHQKEFGAVRTVAAIALNVAPDGTRSTVLYRHPSITHNQAILFAQQAFSDIAEDANKTEPDPSPDLGTN